MEDARGTDLLVTNAIGHRARFGDLGHRFSWRIRWAISRSVPVFVVTHNVADGWSRDDAPFTLVTDGVESAVGPAAAVAGDGIVGVGAADIVQQGLNASLLGEIVIGVVPVLLGEGIRAAARRLPLRGDMDR